MTSENHEAAGTRGLPEGLCRLLAGVEAGFFGSLIAIGWYIIHSGMSGEFWWSKLNVAGGPFYGNRVYSMGAGLATAAGAALLIVVYSAGGALFSAIAPARAPVPAMLAALAYSSASAFALNRWFIPMLDPFAPSFFPAPVILAGHLLYSLVLGRFPYFHRVLAEGLGPAPAAQERVQPPVAPDAPTPSGEDAGENPRAHIVEAETDRLE